MKKILWLLPVLLFSSCSDNHIPGSETEAQTYESGKSYRVGKPENEIGLKILEFYESRCPEEVECIWHGYAGVKLEVSIGTRTFTDSLYTPGYPHMNLYKTKEFQAEGLRYSITLEDVLPYPCNNCGNPGKPKAILDVKQL